jgi:hypothetical protein
MTHPDTTTSAVPLHLDATAIKVLAHPLRSRLLTQLRLAGPATATGLAAALTTNTGATSYHLRRLASVGLVVDTGEGSGRQRLWRASTESHSWDPSDVAGDDDAEAALDWLVRDYLRHFVAGYSEWLDAAATWPVAWRDAAGMGDGYVIATPEQARALAADVGAVVERYRLAGSGDPRARRLAVYGAVFPLDLAAVVDEEDPA